MGDGAVSQPGLRPMHHVRGREPGNENPRFGRRLGDAGQGYRRSKAQRRGCGWPCTSRLGRRLTALPPSTSRKLVLRKRDLRSLALWLSKLDYDAAGLWATRCGGVATQRAQTVVPWNW